MKTEHSEPQHSIPQRFLRIAPLARGFRATTGVAFVVAVYGVLMGAIAAGNGMTLAELMLMSAIVFAGASQLAAVGLWLHPLPVLEILLATFVINLRYFLLCAALNPLFQGYSLARRLFGIHFVADENWAVTMEAHRRGKADPHYLFGAGLVLFILWQAGGALGVLFGNRLPPPQVMGLDFAVPAVFLALLLGFWRNVRLDALVWSVSAGASVAAWAWLPGKWYILVGALCGSLAAALDSRLDEGLEGYDTQGLEGGQHVEP